MREVAILGTAGGALGLLLAVWGSRALARLFADLPRMQEVRFDWTVVLFTTVITGMAALIFGLTPAVQITRRELNSVLARGGRARLGGRLFQQILVSAQFTITVILLAGAGLLLRSYYNLNRVQPGFSTADTITFHVGAEWAKDRAKLGLMQHARSATAERRLLTVFALSALLSAALGLYGLVMLAVTARTKEIGLRMALGAHPRQILAHVLGEAGRSLGIALIVGAGVAMLTLRAFRSMLYDVTPADGLTFASVCALLLVVAALAAVIPGRRATKIDPLEALRSE